MKNGLSKTLFWWWLITVLIILFKKYNEWYKQPKNWEKYGKNDIALITGGSKGLGKEIVLQLLSQNVTVLVLDIQEPDYSGSTYIHCDLSDETKLKSSINNIINDLNEKSQNISLLINNAGIRHSESLINLPDEKILKIFTINTFSHIYLIKAIYKNHQKFYKDKRLYITSISSVLGMIGPKNLSIYSASKAAVIQIFESLMQEIVLENVRLLLVTPGQLTSGMFDGIDPSSQFFAPIFSHTLLAKKILVQINLGKIGVILDPIYANFIPIIKSLPISIQQFCRWLSGMDDKIKE